MIGPHTSFDKLVLLGYSIPYVSLLHAPGCLQSGDAKITNHTIPGEEANIKFHAYSYFSRERQRRVRDWENLTPRGVRVRRGFKSQSCPGCI